ncbi:hypothetical protein FRC02_000513 [Tulasnella sp. 418]|nr:hypothetical protein FRC02_000513 [Tulasnella sp. 418]
MSAYPTTPTRTPSASTHRAELLQNSPHYTTTRKHSLYGIEDRIVLDPGSRIWKVGFSGEGRPRDVFYVTSSALAIDVGKGKSAVERAEMDRVAEQELQEKLRSVFFDYLLTDPKTRKVIVIEHPLLSLSAKDMMARILFQNLQVLSVSFMSSHILSLLAVGRMTGLVIDCGHSETTALPIYSSRPLFACLKSTPYAGSRLTSHLRSLLLLFASYNPPPAIVRAAAMPGNNSRVPEEILTEALLEQIKTKICFVGNKMEESLSQIQETLQADDNMSVDDSASVAESETQSQSTSVAGASASLHSAASASHTHPESHLRALSTLYQRHSSASDIRLKVVPPAAQAVAAGSGASARGTLIIPGWIRERAAEVLFDGGDVDEKSIVEVILDVLVKIPMDLRKELVSSIVVTGGTTMLPGFIPRLQAELVKALSTHPPPTPSRPNPMSRKRTRSFTEEDEEDVRASTPTPAPKRPARATPSPTKTRPPYDPFLCIRSLAPHVAILNNPSPNHTSMTSGIARANAGKAPAFAPALIPWVGGSLAGSLKIGEEITREKWEEAYLNEHEHQLEQQLELVEQQATPMDEDILTPPRRPAAIPTTDSGMRPPAFTFIPDWTRTPLASGAPPAVGPAAGSVPPNVMSPGGGQTVGISV